MKVIIVIPTYNESENIGRLVDELEKNFKTQPQHEYHILVVEGNSPDGTAEIVKKKSQEKPFLHLLMEEKKAGLGAAYTFGFKYAMKTFDPDVIVEMDADFQHDPKDVLRLVDAIQEGNDYAIGSRYVKGGGIPGEWGIHRKIQSLGGSWFSKIVLGIFSINDFTSGFKASRVKGFVDKIDLDGVLSAGFAYKLDLLFKMHKLGAKIKEVPIIFGLRDRGDSKMEKNNIIDSMRVVITLRINDSKTFIKFCIVGFAGLVVDMSVFNIFMHTLSTPKISSFLAGIFGMLTTFTLNNFWSFGDRKLSGTTRTLSSIVVYFGSSYIPIIFRSFIVGYAISHISDSLLVANIAFFIGIIIGLIWNFTVYSKIIWRNKNA